MIYKPPSEYIAELKEEAERVAPNISDESQWILAITKYLDTKEAKERK